MAIESTEEVQPWLLNKATVSELKMLQGLIAMKLQMQFKVGDKVWFDAKTRGIIHGTIVKQNAKSVKVQATTGANWTVSPAFLQPDS